MRSLAIFFFSSCSFLAIAQSPVADFTLPANGCRNENIKLKNLSINASQFEWDFCQGDLAASPTATFIENINGSVTTGLDVVFDGTNWFGFVASRETNSILRLDFAQDIYSVPTIKDLGNISGNINRPIDIKVVEENGNWFGFVYGLDDPLISRINFGNSLSNTTSSSTPITADVIAHGSGSGNGGFDLTYDGTAWVMVICINTSFTIIRLATLLDIPSVGDIISGVNNPYGLGMGDITLQKYNGNFYGYVTATGNQSLQRLSFGSTLFTTPSIDDITSSMPSGSTPFGIDGGYDNGNFYLLMATIEGNLLKINLGSDLSLSPVSKINLGNFSILNNTLKIRLIKQKSNWIAFAPAWNTTQLFRIDFPNPSACQGNLAISTLSDPVINYGSPGLAYITLRTFNGGSFDEISKSVMINNTPAPDIDFSSQNVCVNNAVNFSASNLSGNVTSYAWDFGDTNSSSGSSSISHIYTATGNFDILLNVAASNGCNNFVERSITIFNPPVAGFTLPAPAISCTNQNYPFTNASTSDAGSIPTWQWNIDANPVSMAKDLDTSFPDTNNHSVQLVTSIPGCSSQSTKSFSVQQQGPLTNFSTSGICHTDQTQFTNLTTGAVTSYAWDFGDGNTSSQINPFDIYPTPGTYTITLVANNAIGCQNTSVQTIKIYSKPQTDFTLDLPPFSCSGSASQFRDATPPPTDSNLASWLWDFADPSSGQNSSIQKNPLHTYATAGNYGVKLTVTSNNNCSTTIQKTINIAQSPVPNFTSNAPCKDQSTNFLDATANSKSWNWQIGSTFYNNIPNPVHIFTSPGNYTINLNVTGNNNCVASLSRVIKVPVPLSPDFSFLKNCAGQNTSFIDQTIASADPVMKRDWDFAGLGVASGSPAVFSFNTVGNYGVKLKVTAQSGCAYTVAKNVNIVASPIASFTATPESGVPPLLVKFNNESILATDYLWTFHDTSNSTTTVASPSYTFQDFGDYIVDLTASNAQGCSNTFTKVIRAVLPLNDIAVTAFSIKKNADGSLNAIATIKNYGNVTINNATISMDLSGNATVRENLNVSVAPNQTYNHLFSYAVTNVKLLTYICADAEVDDDVDLNNNRLCTNLDQQLFLYDPYPNPARTELHLDLIASDEQVVVATIVDALGKQVMNISFQVDAGLNQFVIPTENIPTGIYIVTIQTSSEKKVHHVAILR